MLQGVVEGDQQRKGAVATKRSAEIVEVERPQHPTGKSRFLQPVYLETCSHLQFSMGIDSVPTELESCIVVSLYVCLYVCTGLQNIGTRRKEKHNFGHKHAHRQNFLENQQLFDAN